MTTIPATDDVYLVRFTWFGSTRSRRGARRVRAATQYDAMQQVYDYLADTGRDGVIRDVVKVSAR